MAIPRPSPSPSHIQEGKGEFSLWAVSKISWTTTPRPSHPQLESIKEASNKKTQTAQHSSGGQQEGDHVVVHHVHGEHYQRKGLG